MFFFSVINVNDNYMDSVNVKEVEMKLIIPKIGFNMNMYYGDSSLNDVDHNIEVLDVSNIDDKLFYIVGHSGSGDNCYFNRIKELVSGDFLYVDLEGDILIYEVKYKYFIVKNGSLEIDSRIYNRIFLITCDLVNNDRQLVIEGILVN